MAEDKKKKSLTVRERAEKAIQDSSKPKTEKTQKREKKPKKERRFHIIPRYFRDSFKELRTVTWPDRKNTTKLTIAVIVFALVFSIIVGIVDYLFGLIFKRIFLHG